MDHTEQRLRQNNARQRPAHDVGQAEIQEHGVGMRVDKDGQPLQPIGGLPDLISPDGQGAREGRANLRVILHHQHGGHVLKRRRLPLGAATGWAAIKPVPASGWCGRF